MVSLESSAAVTASIVPFDPTVGVTVVASIALVIFVAFMLFLTFASTPPAADTSHSEYTQSESPVETAEPTD